MSANLTPGETLILPDGKYIAVLASGGTMVFGSLILRPDGNLTLGYLDPPPANMTYNPHHYVARGYTQPHLLPSSGPEDPAAITLLDLDRPDTSISSSITYYEPKETPLGPREKIGPIYTPCTNVTVTALGSGSGGGIMVSGGMMMTAGNISHIEILGLN